jgi:hypothetical protein
VRNSHLCYDIFEIGAFRPFDEFCGHAPGVYANGHNAFDHRAAPQYKASGFYQSQYFYNASVMRPDNPLVLRVICEIGKVIFSPSFLRLRQMRGCCSLIIGVSYKKARYLNK